MIVQVMRYGDLCLEAESRLTLYNGFPLRDAAVIAIDRRDGEGREGTRSTIGEVILPDLNRPVEMGIPLAGEAGRNSGMKAGTEN